MPTNSRNNELNTFKILIASDIHLGVYEKNPIPKEDSFEAFEEVLSIGNRENVDFVLLGGDLFHENMPSREILFKTYNILNKHIYGVKKFNYTLTSNSELNASSVKYVNYTDPNIRIKLPIFSINGNHDNPVGSEALAVLDLLDMNKYVNYFGKVTDFEKITISPLIFQKGSTKLAVYGIGSIRDERFRNFLLSGAVKWDRLQNDSEYFKILVLHQNRNRPGIKGPKTGDAVNGSCNIDESLLPDFFDLIIWGHEHESKMFMEPSKYPGKNFKIIQPGSTVQTSVSKDEMTKKKVGILTIANKSAKITSVNLKTPRDLLIETLNIDNILKDNEGIKDDTIIIEDLYSIAELRNKLKEIMIKEIQRILEEHVEAARGNTFVNTNKLPLVRIRIQTQTKKSVFTAINLSNDLDKRIANPSSSFIVLKKQTQPKEKGDNKNNVNINNNSLHNSVINGMNSVDLIRAADLKANSENSREAISHFLKKVLKEQLEKNNTMEIFSEVDFLDTFEEFVKDLDLTVINSHFLAKNESVIKMININKNINNINELKSICIRENKLKKEKEDSKETVKRNIEREWKAKKTRRKPKKSNKSKILDESSSDIDISSTFGDKYNNDGIRHYEVEGNTLGDLDENSMHGINGRIKPKSKRTSGVKKIKKLQVIDVAEKEKEELERNENISMNSQYIHKKENTDLSSFMNTDDFDEELPKFEKYE